MKKYKVLLVLMFIFILPLGLLSSCTEKNEVVRVKDLEFTVVPEHEIPEALLATINEKKADPFKMTFTTKENEYLYIAVGYGAKNTGGYSISVDDLFLSTNAIYINTTLIGPGKDLAIQAITYPYIVVKVEYMDKNVVFQ